MRLMGTVERFLNFSFQSSNGQHMKPLLASRVWALGYLSEGAKTVLACQVSGVLKGFSATPLRWILKIGMPWYRHLGIYMNNTLGLASPDYSNSYHKTQ